MARPSSYTKEKADEICARISEGQSIRSVCMGEGMPDAKTLYKWLRENDEFLQQYTRAKQEQADALAEEMLDIADDCPADSNGIQKARLRIETRKWLASKLKPKKYSDRTYSEITGQDGKDLIPPLNDIDRARRLAFIFTSAEISLNEQAMKGNNSDQSI